MIIFIDILDGILNEAVQFPRTKLQPLLPHQALMQPNRFKKAAQQFTGFYNIQWMLSNHSNNNKKRDRVCCIYYKLYPRTQYKHVSVSRIGQKKYIIRSPNVYLKLNSNYKLQQTM